MEGCPIILKIKPIKEEKWEKEEKALVEEEW